MFEPGPGVRVEGPRVRAVRSRRVKEGVHVFPTASTWLPAGREERRSWRVKIGKMATGMAIGVKSPWLDEGRVFGRKASVGMVWWLGNTGQIFDGNKQLKSNLFAQKNDGSPEASVEAPPVNLKFQAGDVLEVAMDYGRLTFRVNQVCTAPRV